MAEPDTLSDEPMAYTLSELAEASGVTERTIRYYQAERVLPRPGKHGRDAVYGDEHLDRLVLIGELRDRGLTLSTIRDLVATDSPVRTVSEWLGVDATLSAPWSDDRPRTFTQDELAALVAEYGATKPGVIGELQHAGFVTPFTDGTWTVDSPTLLRHALQLRQAGVDIEVTARVRDLLRRRLAKAVDDTVKLLVERTGTGFAGGASPEEIDAAVGALRPVALEMSSIVLAQEVERALSDLVDSGPKRLSRSRRR
jgi:DNA-binding transcriptional MerR regulator